ncbi:MAG: PIG-L deacetylase family protein [Planctomycetota bacterium]|nr:PIG-L deacetylase family protein [Planctomycetota bacterium]
MRVFDPSTWSGHDVLVVAPHPDDEAFGPGGTVHLLARSGKAVLPLVVCRGDGGVTGDASWEDREDESRRGCRILGTEDPLFARIPSSEVNEDPRAAGRALEQLLEGRSFDLVLVPSPLERHQTHRSCLTAMLLSGLGSDAVWMGYGCWDAIPAAADTFETDITDARRAKTGAMTAHDSQTRERGLAPGMSSRDLSQAVFSKVTGSEERRAVERFLDLSDLRATANEAVSDVASAQNHILKWLNEKTQAWSRELWGEGA